MVCISGIAVQSVPQRLECDLVSSVWVPPSAPLPPEISVTDDITYLQSAWRGLGTIGVWCVARVWPCRAGTAKWTRLAYQLVARVWPCRVGMAALELVLQISWLLRFGGRPSLVSVLQKMFVCERERACMHAPKCACVCFSNKCIYGLLLCPVLHSDLTAC